MPTYSAEKHFGPGRNSIGKLQACRLTTVEAETCCEACGLLKFRAGCIDLSAFLKHASLQQCTLKSKSQQLHICLSFGKYIIPSGSPPCWRSHKPRRAPAPRPGGAWRPTVSPQTLLRTSPRHGLKMYPKS